MPPQDAPATSPADASGSINVGRSASGSVKVPGGSTNALGPTSQRPGTSRVTKKSKPKRPPQCREPSPPSPPRQEQVEELVMGLCSHVYGQVAAGAPLDRDDMDVVAEVLYLGVYKL